MSRSEGIWRRRRRLAVARNAGVALALVALAGGCGGGDDEDGGGGGTQSSKLAPPEKPAAADCRADVLKTDVKPSVTPTPPGRYTYAMQGTRRDLRASGVPVALPRSSPLTVTESTQDGNIICFRGQTAYTSKQANTITFAIRGGDLYIASIDFFVAGQTLTLKPDPPIKAIDGSGATDWSGTFSGPTKGSYTGSALGRRSFTFQGRSERALGVELKFDLTGELRAKISQTLWLSLDRGTVYEQKVNQRQDFGTQPIQLEFAAKLKSYKKG